MKKTVALVALILAFIQIAAQAQSPAKPSKSTAAEMEIAALDRQIQEAIAAGDAKIIERYVGDDLVFTHGFFEGGTETKQKLLENAKKTVKFYAYRRVSKQKVEAHGDVALVLGRLDVRRQPLERNKETAEMCYALNFVHLFAKRKGRWQLISHRSARMVEETKLCASAAEAQKVETSKPQNQNNAATEREIREFFDSYAEDLRSARREAIADRYDQRGYYRVGNGSKTLVSFEDNKKRYVTRWTGPKSFEWKDLSIEILSPDAAAVIGLFNWQTATGEKAIISYTGLLIKQAGKWRIRVEDESVSPLGYTIQPVSGDRAGGAVKYTLTAQPGASIAAHRHSAEMKIR